MTTVSPIHPELRPGDVIAIRRRHQGQAESFGRIARVLGLPHRSAWPCRVRWEDTGLEELLYPRADLLIERLSRRL